MRRQTTKRSNIEGQTHRVDERQNCWPTRGEREVQSPIDAMAGTHRSPTEGGRNGTPPARVSPRPSIDATLDLLTGMFPSARSSSNPFAPEQAAIIDGVDRHHTSPTTQVGSLGTSAEARPTYQNSIYSSNQPLDLLTGLFPPLPSVTAHSPAAVSPPPAEPQQDVWGADILGHPSFGSRSTNSSIELFGTSDITTNNPFLGNAIIPPAYSPPHVHPVSHTSSADEPDVSNRVSRSGTRDGSFANFPPLSESSSGADLGSRPSYSGSTGVSSPPTSRVSQSQTVLNCSSPSTTGNSDNFAAPVPDSYPTSELPRRLSSTSSPGSGFERMQDGSARAESPSSAFQTSVSPPPQTENLRRSISESKYEQWMTPEVGTSSRLLGKGSGSSTSSPKTGASDDEYVGAPGTGIYKSPVRGAVHPRRPVSLELRPHPLRGAPANQVTLLTCLDGSVWAVCDLGLMVWDIKNATGAGSIARGNNPGDEDAAAYEFLRQGSPASCITADRANQVVWTGHRDGKIRSWSGRATSGSSRESRSASLIFQALLHSVTAILVTPYGELWAGSESGELKAWPWNAVAKALAGVGDCASLMEKKFYDLRIGNIGVGPNGPINPEVRFLVGDHAHGAVWCAGIQFMVIWDARTRDRLKMFVGSNGLDLNSIDVGSPGKETLLGEDLKVGYAKVSGKKDKGGWLQRSRNAVMGAADAVRRAAGGVTQWSEEGRRLEVLVAAADGTVWGGYGNGALTQWNADGYRTLDIQKRNVGVKSVCVVGNRLWVGYSDGKLHVLDRTGNAVGSWLAHRLAVIDMAVCGGYIFSLGLSGSIRGWNISSPTGDLDQIMKAKMTNRVDSYTRQQHLQVLVGTWNTAQEKASLQSTRMWLASDQVAEASVVAVGLQEVEMGAGAIGMAAVKETVGMGLDNLSPTGHWWLTHLDTVLGEGKEFERLGSRQLAGMLVGVWVRRKLLPYIGDIEVGAVSCGFGRTLGNKGAVGIKLTIFRRTICVLTSHLAAHLEHVKNRNADFEHIYNQMSFGRVMRTNVAVVANAAAGVSSAVQNMLRGGNTSRRISITSDQNFIEAPINLDSNAVGEDGGLPELADADLLIWTGDLNYRIEYLSYEEIISLISKKRWDILLAKDQLRFEMGNGRTFQGFREGAIRFQPTYKFDKGTTRYDTSEKKRMPAWCDRVVFRDSFGTASDFTDSSKQGGLVRPCKASVVRYEACMEPKESDHKPLRCMLSVDLSVTDEADRRFEYGDITLLDQDIQTCLAKSRSIPETDISTNGLILEESVPSTLHLSNKDNRQSVVYVVHCEGISFPCPCGKHSNSERNTGEDQYPRGGFGFPPWLQVGPAAGVLGPGDSIKLTVYAAMTPDDRARNQPGQVAVLLVNVKGVFSPDYKAHKICVSRVPLSQTLAKDKGEARRRSLDAQRRPSSAGSDSQGFGSRQATGSTSSFKKNSPDLLL